uniref:DEAD/DEAH box helicase n=1 Tax=Enterocloster clostridioformis TaxID=1531 RepID=UPI001C3D491D|nr:DEAD/DEAH box helicase [Enterocloster clostridioformis]
MLKKSDLDRLESHWAVAAIPEENRKECFYTIEKLKVQKSIKNSIRFNFTKQEDWQNILYKMALAYEMPAIENISSFTNYTDGNCDRGLFAASSWRCFDLYSAMEIPEDINAKIFFVLHICAMAYCGERWNDLKKWFLDNQKTILSNTKDNGNDNWDQRLLKTVFRCWLKLFVKKDWEDLSQIGLEIINLRNSQHIYEEKYLNNSQDSQQSAFFLIALYNLSKSTELLATYIMQGEPVTIHSQLDKHFESSIEAAVCSNDMEFETILRWLHCASNHMIDGSVWWIARAINSRTTDFVKYVTKNQGLFEMLPPQKAAIREQGLLDQASTAIAIEMPTSGGKTLLAEFKLLQALNQFDHENGWVAYVAPTKALVSQITRRLRRDFNERIKVEQLSAAVEINAYESELLESNHRSFDVIVSTPEKLNLVIKNSKVPRPLALVIMDEAHNIEDQERGLRIELLLAAIKMDCPSANFLLLMPYVENAEILSRWLANDVASGKSISIGSTPWKPSERVVGLYEKVSCNGRGNWHLKFDTLLTMSDSIYFSGKYQVNGERHFGKTYSKVSTTDMTAAMAKELSVMGTCLAIARTTDYSWNMAREIANDMPELPEDYKGLQKIRLVQKYLADEMGEDFELIQMLDKGIGVHNASLMDEIKELMEWLAEENCLKVLCATTTIAQGINFPVSSVCIQSISLSGPGYSKDMSPREFWNLAGRAGRIGQNNLGVVGIACKKGNREHLTQFVSKKTGNLISRLVTMLDDIEKEGKLFELDKLIYSDSWTDFRCYIAHLCNEKDKLDDILADMEQLLRNTLGYNSVKSEPNGNIKSKKLLEVAKGYASKLLKNPQLSKLSDQTGFSPEGIQKAFGGMTQLDKKLSVDSFNAKNIFGGSGLLAELYGVMLRIPELKQLEEIAGKGEQHQNIAEITVDWVTGKSIAEIAKAYFSGDDDTKNLMRACKAINKQIANCGTWGLSAITKLSGMNFDEMSEEKKKEIDMLPAMIYHGVNTPEAVLMRMNFVPRSISGNLGNEYRKRAKKFTTEEAKNFLCLLKEDEWEKARPSKSHMSGKEYMQIWRLFSGM